MSGDMIAASSRAAASASGGGLSCARGRRETQAEQQASDQK
jgi:hypothetical protein